MMTRMTRRTVQQSSSNNFYSNGIVPLLEPNGLHSLVGNAQMPPASAVLTSL